MREDVVAAVAETAKDVRAHLPAAKNADGSLEGAEIEGDRHLGFAWHDPRANRLAHGLEVHAQRDDARGLQARKPARDPAGARTAPGSGGRRGP